MGEVLTQTPRPLLLIFCATPEISRSMQRELRLRYAPEGFDTVCVDTSAEARNVLDGDRQVAMLIAEQKEDDPDALQLVRHARERQPDARTILTTPHAAMQSALDAMSQGWLDYFFIEPVVSLEEHLPTLSDYLEDWKRWRDYSARAVQVVGPSRSPESHEVCDFLARNDVHHTFLDAATDAGRAMLDDGGDGAELPVVVLNDGSRLSRPSKLELATGLNLATRPRLDSYDFIIVGAGPAGLAAGVYGASEGLSTLLLETDAPGGQAVQSSRIENYLGFPAGVRGGDLAQRALRQAYQFHAEIVRLKDAVGLEKRGAEAVVRLSDGSELSCTAALIATGARYRKLEAPGVEELIGRGIYYGASMVDAEIQRGRNVCIVGGANSAGQAALHFAKYASSVTLLLRSDALERRMSNYLVERIREAEDIEVLTGVEVAGASGAGHLEGLTLSEADTGRTRSVPADVLFIFIGADPCTQWLGALARDERGFLLTGRDIAGSSASWPLDRDPLPLETNFPGVFAAGDVRHGSIKRVASAVGEGAMACQLVHEYLAERDGGGSAAA